MNRNHFPSQSAALSPELESVHQKAPDSWWVYRYDTDHGGQTLPFGRIVYYATSEQEAQQWLTAQRNEKHTARRAS